MINVSLTEKEIELLKQSINHCLNTCQQKEKDSPCPDCEALKTVLTKISAA